MNKEDVKFLKQLKEDIINGDHVCQAHPRFWVIKDYKEEVVPEGCGEKTIIVGDGESYSLKEFKEYVIKNYDEEIPDEDVMEFIEAINDCQDLEDIRDVTNNYEITNLNYYYEVDVVNKPFISSQTGAFLTKEDAEAHLKANYYHYSDKAHVYALTGWRNPRFEKLLDIVLNTNWEELENED